MVVVALERKSVPLFALTQWALLPRVRGAKVYSFKPRWHLPWRLMLNLGWRYQLTLLPPQGMILGDFKPTMGSVSMWSIPTGLPSCWMECVALYRKSRFTAYFLILSSKKEILTQKLGGVHAHVQACMWAQALTYDFKRRCLNSDVLKVSVEEQRRGSLSRFDSRCVRASYVPPISVEFVNHTRYCLALKNQLLSALLASCAVNGKETERNAQLWTRSPRHKSVPSLCRSHVVGPRSRNLRCSVEKSISLRLAQTTPLEARNNMVNPTSLICVWGHAALKEFKRSLFCICIYI